MKLTDTHAHMDFEQYDADRHDVCNRASNDLYAVINVGIDAKSAAKCLDLSRQYPNFFAAVGFHPNNADECIESDWQTIVSLAENPKTVAIGETGFDLYHSIPFALQEELFTKHIKLADSLGKPVIIHCRNAASELIQFLQQWQQAEPLPRGVVHCFAESAEIARQYLNMGFYIALGGITTFKQNANLAAMIKYIPTEHLLLETDCPFLAPQVHRGQRNEPSFIAETAKVIAQIRGVTLEDLAKQTTQNSQALFKI